MTRWLLIDAGNTAVKWATGDASRLDDAVGRLDNATPDFAARLAAQLAAAPPFTAAVGCCVAGDALRDTVDRAVSARGVPAPTWLQSQAAHDTAPTLASRYRDPLQLGADRWHAMLGARAAHPQAALVVVHAGTATTIDCVTAAGVFAGGAILPGTDLMLEALARRTARLPHARGTPVAFPDNTDDAIVTGIADAQAGAVERIAARFAADQAASVTLLLGGGGAPALQARLQPGPAIAQIELAHNLVLRGLWRRARETAR
jgi:type III pantothenate kinase